MNLSADMQAMSVAGVIRHLDGRIVALTAEDLPDEYALDAAFALRREMYACLAIAGIDGDTLAAVAQKKVNAIAGRG